MKENIFVNFNLYHTLRKSNPEEARRLVRKVLKSTNGNVSKTARILKIDRKTVRRARDGSLKDYSRAPKRVWNKTKTEFETLIVKEAKNTNFGYRRLSKYLFRKYGLKFSENTIKAILRRHSFEKKKVKVRNKRRRLYNYELLRPFEKFQLDTKYILDKNALPQNVYNHVKEKGLPIYQWTLIDVATRIRFLAYSFRLNSTYGYIFISFCLWWLRMHNVRGEIEIRVDNGAEFCGGSERKLRDWNKDFGIWGCELKPIPPRASYLQAIVENSHLRDDEEFFIPYLERIGNIAQFIYRAQQWQDTWNFYRPHLGIGMEGRTPFEALKSKWDGLINLNVVHFPVFLLEDLFFILKGGEYVLTPHLLEKIF